MAFTLSAEVPTPLKDTSTRLATPADERTVVD
jgi:hypothetical protein